MERLGAPLRVIAPGRVFRNEEVDASHEHTFYQIEGMMIDREVSVGHLVYFMKTMLARRLPSRRQGAPAPRLLPVRRARLRARLRLPHLRRRRLPRVQAERLGGADAGCGLVHPNVLRMSGIDPDEWMGFAFGLGLTRLAMMRYGIDDIRLLQSGDLRFLGQF